MITFKNQWPPREPIPSDLLKRCYFCYMPQLTANDNNTREITDD